MRIPIAFVLLCVLSAGRTFGADPATTHAASQPVGPSTQHDYINALLDFNRRTLSEAYKKVGKRDPKWDAEAIELLEGMNLRFTNGVAGMFYELPGQPSDEHLLQLAESVRTKGCDDPMVAYSYAAILAEAGRRREADKLIDEAANNLMTSHYPVSRLMNAAGRQFLASSSGGTHESYAAAWGKLRDSILATISTWDFATPDDRRILFANILRWIDRVPADRLKELVDPIKEIKGADPWLVEMITGKYEIEAAWAARGGGWANTVTPAGWREFFDHLGNARATLKSAWRHHPECPEAPRLMITVGMGGSHQLNEDPGKWFERAIEAQIDDADSYDKYRYALTPRWSGSVEQMEAVGQAALNGGRYETSVPWEYARTMEDVAKERNWPGMWSSPGVYENVKQMCDGYVKANRTPRLVNFMQSYNAAIAWRSTHYADARKLLDTLGDRVDDKPFAHLKVMPKLAMSHAYVASGEFADTMKSAEEKASAGQLDAAIDGYRAAAQKAAAAKDKAARFLQCRLKQLEWQKQFEAGDWVDVTPADDELSGWEALHGKWRREKDGTIVGQADTLGPVLTCQSAFIGARFEAEVTVDRGNEAPPLPMAIGFALAFNDPYTSYGFGIRHGGGEPTIASSDLIENSPSQPIELKGTTTTLGYRCFDSLARVRIDDKTIWSMGEHVNQAPPAGFKTYLSITGPENDAGTEIRVKKVRVKRLTEVPGKE